MDLTRLRAFLRRHRRIALDACVFIYQLEANGRYVALTDPVFAWLELPDRAAVTSTITMTELLVQPHRDSGEGRAGEFYALLTTYPNLTWIAPNLEVADIAAKDTGGTSLTDSRCAPGGDRSARPSDWYGHE